MELYEFILVLIYFASLKRITAQESWETVYKSFQGKDPNDAQGWSISQNYYGNVFTTCNGFTLLGGFNAFGASSMVTKQFYLPPHYQIKLTLDFWKIDSWDSENVYLIIDDKLWSQNYIWWQGSQLCGQGNGWNEIVQPITITMNHTLESVIFILTTSLDQSPGDESWGFRNFILSILRCPQGCLYCQDNDYNNCYYWIGFLSLWHQTIDIDGWMKNNNTQPAIYKCGSFNLVGGYLNLKHNDKLEKIIENLNPHYKIQLQLQFWIIDSQSDKSYFLEVDDQFYNLTTLQNTGFYYICGSTGLEKIINIGFALSHSLSQSKITMTINFNPITTNAYWGIRAFNIYLAKCFKGCDQCLGPLKTDCTVCSSEWVFYNNLCTYSPPMLFSQISINQIKDPKSDERITMEINLLEVDQQIITQGNFTQSFKNNQQILTIQIYVKCFSNTTIKSQFQSNKFQDFYLYQFQHNCQEDFNSVIYSVKFQQRSLTEQELIIITSNTHCLIYQVVRVGDEFTFVKILEIVLEDI